MQEELLELIDSEIDDEKIDGVIIGLLVGINDEGEPLVDFFQNRSSISVTARSTIILDQKDIGREITLLFEQGDYQKPIVTGLIQPPKVTFPDNGNGEIEKPTDIFADGERIVFEAKREIVLKCGKASITITRAGKIIIRGAYLLSRSSGVNRIKGGSVQIN